MTAPQDVRAHGLRGDVQGLRAVAVLVVVAGHAGLPFLPGGFVGVDVFFVISGFLISQLLFRQVQRSGTVGLGDFYARRARRILPAATVVTVVTVVAAAAWLAVVDALEVVTDAWWSTFFAANVRFASLGTDYFAQDRSESPLQHYWSLSVEEQFYLVWPLLLLLCVLGRRWRRGLVAGVLVAVTAASFAYGVWLTSHDPTSAYFSTPARAWELAVGALAALVAPRLTARWTPRLQSVVGLAGLGAITVACVTFSGATAFPGTAALLPVLGSAAVLLAGVPGVEGVWPSRLLGVGPLRLVGDWSYSLYLWHWPLLVLPATAAGRDLAPWEAGLAVAAAFVLAGLTYRYVETPWRRPRPTGARRRGPRPSRGLVLYPGSVAVVAVTCLLAASYGEAQVGGDGPVVAVDRSRLEAAGVTVDDDPTVALVQASVVAARDGQDVPGVLTPSLLDLRDDTPDVGDCDYEQTGERGLCAEGDPAGTRTLVVLGNSHARMWIPAFERIAEHDGWRTYYLVKPNCSVADVTSGLQTGERSKEPDLECVEFREWAIGAIADLSPDLVVVSSTGPGPFVVEADGRATRVKPEDPFQAFEGFRRLFDRLALTTDRVVLLRDIPRIAQAPDQCLTGRDADLGSCLWPPLLDREAITEASVAAADAADVDVVDPRPWLCWDGECPAVIGDLVSYRDQDHLTTAYAAELGDDLGRELGTWRD
ncbi:MAG: oatA [Nocardioides sp.]|nr:oatA [Nocardioides sp.]